MSDVQDPLQDSFEQLLQKSVYPAPDKKIVFGARKPTEDAFALIGVPLIIEAPFPYERTLQWVPGNPAQDKKVDADAAGSEDSTGEEAVPSLGNPDGADAESAFTDKTHAAMPSLMEIGGHTAVVVSQEVLLKVNEHVSQSLERELGGFLLGNRYSCPNTPRDYVIIDQYSPAKFTESTEVNLAFTHEAWAQLSDELSGKFLGKLLIGWYHSHPRMDVFLSSHDMEIQTERFPEPWMVALVLEPEKHRGGFFCARDGRVKPNSPVDFFELLERNSRDSVLAWENYTAVDPATSSAPVMSATNTASLVNSSSQEILVARSQQSKKVPVKRRRRGRLLISVVVVALLLVAVAAAVANRKKLKNWLQNKTGGVPATQQQVPTTEQQLPTTQQQVPTTEQQLPTTEQRVPTTQQQVPATEQQVPATEQRVPATEQQVPATEQRVPATPQQVPARQQQVPATQGRRVPGKRQKDTKLQTRRK